MSKATRAFSLEPFLEGCRNALSDASPQKAVQELLTRAVSSPAPLIRELGEPRSAGIQTLHRSDDLTVLNVIWAPYMTLKPHNHRMWAVIGVYTGREDNIFWRQLPDDRKQRIEAAGARSLSPMETVPLGRDIIHSVNNPVPRFFAPGRSEWDPETLEERPFDFDTNLRLFREVNARYGKS